VSICWQTMDFSGILPGRCFMESVRSVEENNEVEHAQIKK
jgi:hypothetical protein